MEAYQFNDFTAPPDHLVKTSVIIMVNGNN